MSYTMSTPCLPVSRYSSVFSAVTSCRTTTCAISTVCLPRGQLATNGQLQWMLPRRAERQLTGFGRAGLNQLRPRLRRGRSGPARHGTPHHLPISSHDTKQMANMQGSSGLVMGELISPECATPGAIPMSIGTAWSGHAVQPHAHAKPWACHPTD